MEISTLWAKIIRNGCHKSYDEPLLIPLITGQQRGCVQSKKDSLSDAIVGVCLCCACSKYSNIHATCSIYTGADLGGVQGVVIPPPKSF